MSVHVQSISAVSKAISAARDDLASDATFQQRVMLMFGQSRGRELVKNNHAVRDAAAAMCERCMDRLSRAHWSYDLNEHMAAKALYEAACQRIRKTEALSFSHAAE